MKTYGYARVSSADQNATRQLDAMEKAGIARANIFVDHKSGRDFDHPAWQRLVDKVRRGDLIVVTSLDRLGRDYEEIGEVWRRLTKERGVDIRVLNVELLDTRRRAPCGAGDLDLSIDEEPAGLAAEPGGFAPPCSRRCKPR